MPQLPLILLVEADAATRLVVHCALRAAGLDVVECAAADAVWALLESRRPAGAVVGRAPGEPDAWTLVRELRRRGFTQPVVLAGPGTPSGDLPETGVHLVVDRNATPARWIKDLQALLPAEPRRSPGTAGAIRVGALVVGADGAAVDARGSEIPLTALERRTLAILVRHAGRPVSRDQFVARVQDGPRMGSHAFDSLLWRLRRKLEAHGAGAQWLRHRAGEGYVLRPGPGGAAKPTPE